MTKPTSLKLDLSSVQIAARLWVSGKGCRYFHSENLSEKECLALFDELAASQMLSDEGSADPIFGQVRGRMDAFFVVQRAPDPNNPERNVTNSWYFLDKTGALTLPMLETFASNPAIADTQSEFVSRLKTTDFSPKTSSNDSNAPTTVREVETSGAHKWSERLKILRRIGILGLGLLTVFCIYVFSRPSETQYAEPPASEAVLTRNTNNDARWVTEKVKEQLRETVRAKHDSGWRGEVNDLDGEELLQEFLDLFLFDIAKLGLSPGERQNMEQQLESKTPNPFAAFLLGLRDNQEVVDKSLDKSMNELYHAHLTQLASRLCCDQSGSALDIKLLNPEEVITALRNRLDYRDYYEKWHSQFQPYQKKDTWLVHWDVEGDRSWIPTVREWIKKNY
jgi:hypothetical protein